MAYVEQVRPIWPVAATSIGLSSTGCGPCRRWRTIDIATTRLVMKVISFAQFRSNTLSIIITSINIELSLALHGYPGILTRS